MNNFTKNLKMIVLQHLNESKFHDAARALERESGIFFNLKHVEEKVIAGEWEELEKYLLGFTKIDDNRYSFEMFFQIRKQKCLEAIDRNESASAVEILKKDLRVFSCYHNDKFREMCYLLSMDNLRKNTMFRDYVDAQTSRIDLVTALKKLVEANPIFDEKLAFPSFSPGTLLSMLKESHNMQRSSSVTTTATSAAVPFANLVHRNAYPSLDDWSFHQSGAFASANRLSDWTGKSVSSLLEQAAATATCLPNFSSPVSSLKRPLPQPAPGNIDCPIVDDDQFMKRLRTTLSSNEVTGDLPSASKLNPECSSSSETL